MRKWGAAAPGLAGGATAADRRCLAARSGRGGRLTFGSSACEAPRGRHGAASRTDGSDRRQRGGAKGFRPPAAGVLRRVPGPVRRLLPRGLGEEPLVGRQVRMGLGPGFPGEAPAAARSKKYSGREEKRLATRLE